jgi:FkbM family methyltransferase
MSGSVAAELKRVVGYARTHAPWRLAFPNRTVRRRVQGVDLYLPWSHHLPDWARSCPTYGQNLVDLAVELGSRQPGSGPLGVVDVGANVGDSALQIIAKTPARVLCVEGDPYWSEYLRRNVAHRSEVTIAAGFLTDPDLPWSSATPVADGTTTHFVEDAASTIPTIAVEELRTRFPDFDQVRLIKSDTDGLDVGLVPALARAWRDCGPVLFFEFDPRLTRAAGIADPTQVWERLLELGYTRGAVWDNGGSPLGQLDLRDAARHAAVLERSPRELGYHFWDVAARREDDVAAAEVFDLLVPTEFAA